MVDVNMNQSRMLKLRTVVFSILTLNVSFNNYSSLAMKFLKYMVVNPYSYGVVARFFSKPTVICSENDIPYLSSDLALEGEVKPKRRLLIVQNLMIINP